MTAFVSVAATSSEMSVWRGKLSFQEILWSLGIPITVPFMLDAPYGQQNLVYRVPGNHIGGDETLRHVDQLQHGVAPLWPLPYHKALPICRVVVCREILCPEWVADPLFKLTPCAQPHPHEGLCQGDVVLVLAEAGLLTQLPVGRLRVLQLTAGTGGAVHLEHALPLTHTSIHAAPCIHHDFHAIIIHFRPPEATLEACRFHKRSVTAPAVQRLPGDLRVVFQIEESRMLALFEMVLEHLSVGPH
mmetsp:Transcript_2904/g.8495  ORF Transcript_2904/g.8495 Transcript_2904/m.8495 type:complete len:245 (-) Transcript_2904:477-1211(-)|eukprot:CAMPEP_0206138290 /NCGR_PEP_ID=MMETSP1473-20131121/3203_1 /ASSEMBLY_ACC=CAM_ASM_001109 /TAXON_ID=1461547 /ORGANISM="Stichococcus sp, Strain RCC1054" /LENGTH=244 /DNA_ID=CAMNT_0053531663 /DNA_START=495 /DNA_END=1229 /DNA_ORIENTATION=+